MIKKIKYEKLSLFFIVFIINFIVAIKLKMLHISTDEMGVLSSAAYFSGYDWSGIVSKLDGYYGFGQSIMYIPLFLIIKNPIHLYKAILILNSIIVSIIPIIVYKIIDEYLDIKTEILKYLISLACALFPTYLIYSKWAWYEAILSLVPWIILLILLHELKNYNKKYKLINSILLGVILCYSYACHGRALAFILATFIVILIVSIINNHKIAYYSALVGTIGIFYCIFNYLKIVLLKNLWRVSGEGDLVNTLPDSLKKIFDIFSKEGFLSLTLGFLGQFFYAMTSSYGIVLLAIIIIIKFIFENRNKFQNLKDQEKNFFLICLYGIILFMIALSISVVFLQSGISDPDSRGDYLIYGRYFSNVVGILIFICLYSFCNKKITAKQFLMSIILFIVCSILVLIFISPKVNSRTNIANIPILNILPYIGTNPIYYINQIDFVRLIMITGIIFVIILVLAYKKKYILAMISICICFLYTYYYVAYNMIIPNSDTNYNQVVNSMSIINNFDNMYEKYPNIYYVDENNNKPWSDSKLQFALPNYKIQTYKGQIEDMYKKIIPNSIIISTEDLKLENTNSNIFRINAPTLNRNYEYMWGYGNEIRDYLVNKNILCTNESSGDLYQYNTINGEYTLDGIRSNGEEGFLLYGPYIALEKGIYEIKIKGKILNNNYDQLGYVDVVKDGTDELWAETITKSNFVLDNSIIDKSIEVTLNENVKNFEFRIYTNNDVLIEVEYIKILKKK